jgi:hypothetical protein
MAGIVAPKVAIADGTAYAYFNGGDDGGDYNHGDAHKELIETVQLNCEEAYKI